MFWKRSRILSIDFSLRDLAFSEGVILSEPRGLTATANTQPESSSLWEVHLPQLVEVISIDGEILMPFMQGTRLYA